MDFSPPATDLPASAPRPGDFSPPETDRVAQVGVGAPASGLGSNWERLYGGLDDLDRRLDEGGRRALSALDRVAGAEPREIRARAINQAFVGHVAGSDRFGAAASNWGAVKDAFVGEVFGVSLKDASDEHVYGMIAKELASGREAEVARAGEIKSWTFRDSVASKLQSLWRGSPNPMTAGRRNSLRDFWESINVPSVELPRAPAGLPDERLPGQLFSPAVLGGVWNAVAPAIEGFTSPLGVATVGVGSKLHAVGKVGERIAAAELVSSPALLAAGDRMLLAKKALGGISGLFAASMAKATVDAAPGVKAVLDDPRATTQERVEALATPVVSGMMAVAGAFGAVHEFLPGERAIKLNDRLQGKSPSQAAEVLRREAATAEPRAADAMQRAASTLDEFAGYAPGPPESEFRSVGGEKIAAAAIRTPDGEVHEGAEHAAIAADIGGSPHGGEEGFVTSTGRFVDRTEARAIAENADQIKPASSNEVADIMARLLRSEEDVARLQKEAEAFDNDQKGTYERRNALPREIRDAYNRGDEAAQDARELLGMPEAMVSEIKEALLKRSGAAGSASLLHAHEVEYAPEPEFPRSSFGQTSLKNAYGELERVAYGFPEATPTEQRNMTETWVRSAEILAENPKAGEQIAERLLKDPHVGLTDDQSALLLRHKDALQKALNHAADIAADAAQSDELRSEARAQVNELSDQLLRLLDAVNRRGTEVGREMRWRQAIAKEDYSFAAQETLLRAAAGGRELTALERETLTKRVKELEAAQARYEAKIAELTAETRERSADHAVRDLAKPPAGPRRFRGAEAVRSRLHAKAEESKDFLFKSGRLFAASPEVLYHMSVIGADAIYSTGLDFAEWSAEMLSRLGEKAKPLLAEAWGASRKMFYVEHRAALLDDLKSAASEDRRRLLGSAARELARDKLAEGVEGRDAVVDAVHADLKEAIPEITRREAMDAISGYGEFKPLSHDQLTDQLRDLKGQLQQVAKLEDMAAGQAPRKTGVERRTPSDEERRLAREVEAKKKEGGYAVTDPERQLRTALMSVKRNLENRIKDLARELETGERAPAGEPPPTDPRAEALKALRDRIKETVEAAEGTPEVDPEERIRRAVEATTASIDRLERDLNEGKVFPEPTKTSEPWSPALTALRKDLDDLRAFRKEMQRFVRPPKTPEERALAAVKSNLKRQIESLEKQIAARERTAKARKTTALDGEADALKARRDELKEQFEQVFGRPEMSDEQRLNVWKATAKRRIDDLQRRFAERDFSPAARRPPPRFDAEAARLKGQVERLRQDFWIERKRVEEEGAPTWLKFFRTTSGVARGSAISGYHTLGKLASFSLARFAEAVPNEAVGALLRNVPGVDAVARKASMESGAEFDGLARFFTKAATAGARDALETLTPGNRGKSLLKAELGDVKQVSEPVHWYDFSGVLHAAEKSPLLRAEFELRLEKLHRWALANGLDVTDPLVAGALRKEAFDYAQRSILMEKNAFSDWANSLTTRLEAAHPKTGKVDLTKAALATFVKTFLTKGIVKTPANYVMQTLERTPLGLAKGTAELVVAHMRGVEKLTPEEANAIMRLMKVGAVGSAVFVWGAIDATQDPKDRIFGGYYQPGDKRADDDVGFGRIRVGGWEMPHVVTHNPLTESAQMGSTFYRVMKSKLKGARKGEEKGAIAGAAAALVALASEAPVVSPITREVQSVERGEVDSLVWEQLAGLIPMFVQNLASDLDDGKARKATTPAQAFEKNIPGLRSDVPETKAQRERDIRARLKK